MPVIGILKEVNWLSMLQDCQHGRYDGNRGPITLGDLDDTLLIDGEELSLLRASASASARVASALHSA